MQMLRNVEKGTEKEIQVMSLCSEDYFSLTNVHLNIYEFR